MIQRLASRLEQDADLLAKQMATELGKPVRFGKVEALRTAQKLRACGSRSSAPAAPCDDMPAAPRVRRRPHGVVAVITPYNNPIYLSLGKIVPAVLFGNAVVWKPAPAAAEISQRLLTCIHEAGWPDGLVGVLEGGAALAESLMNDARVAAVSLTGSAAAGGTAQRICSHRHIPLQAELGGNNAALVWHDADLPHAARTIAAGAFEMAGQRCTANRRVVVHARRRDRLLELLQQETAQLCWGDPLLRATQIGPLVSDAQRARVADQVSRAVDVCGPAFLPLGAAPSARMPAAPWYPPTIICCDQPDRAIVQNETFGPVLVVQTARDWEHGIELVNGVPQGLAAAVFTHAPHLVHRFLEEARAGILKVNQSTADAAVDVPFGGWKASGVGPPEHGEFDLQFYTRPQTVYPSPC